MQDWCPKGAQPVFRTRLNGDVEIADEIEDAPLIVISGHNGASAQLFLEFIILQATSERR